MEDNDDRRDALRGYGVLDSPNEPEFDHVVREAAAVLRTPIALISLLDENRQWFKAKVGLTVSETPLSISFCTHAARGKDVFVVEDARDDARFRDSPLVTGDPSVRFYAGAPLMTATGARIGTLCVIDTKPRGDPSDYEKKELARLADKVIEILEARKARGASIRMA
ncbi:MAG TPA: GAF domain-containing protein [Sphingomonas sp.]|jgi:GAF domain-containing protein